MSELGQNSSELDVAIKHVFQDGAGIDAISLQLAEDLQANGFGDTSFIKDPIEPDWSVDDPLGDPDVARQRAIKHAIDRAAQVIEASHLTRQLDASTGQLLQRERDIFAHYFETTLLISGEEHLDRSQQKLLNAVMRHYVEPVPPSPHDVMDISLQARHAIRDSGDFNTGPSYIRGENDQPR